MIIRVIDSFSIKLGQLCVVLSLSMTLLTTLVVIIRYVLGSGSIALQETSVYLHASVFMLGAAFALKNGAHVRVDLIYRGCNVKTKAWIDLFGHLVFLLPVCAFILYISWGFVEASWLIKETSSDAGGLPFVYLLKSLIPLSACCLMLQGVAETLRTISKVLAPEAVS